ncbi:hypothetical protein LOZ58_006809 [Ophidiomyces ophidiicola]|nr:hypothetical protein LOZ66_006833 [Ophidiomyces ophidiicola]KAI1955338.1 hypothetical protein LOZ58_006809 [Ophidiomyces ophidiicola]
MSEDQSPKTLEQRVILDGLQYRTAVEEHESLAKDLTRPKSASYIVLTVFESGWRLLTETEKSYTSSPDRSKYRPPKVNRCRFNVTVFFPGHHTIGKPYMTLIPFYVIGDVKIEGTPIEKSNCYDAFGRCDLEISTGGKLGAFLMLDVQ